MRSIIYPAEVFLKSTVLTKRMGLLAVVLGTIGTGAAAPCSATEEALQKSEMGVDTTLTNYPHTLFDSNVPHATDHARAVRTVQAYAAGHPQKPLGPHAPFAIDVNISESDCERNRIKSVSRAGDNFRRGVFAGVQLGSEVSVWMGLMLRYSLPL